MDIKDLPNVAGWQPPLCYDMTTDSRRLVTQDDVDRWVEIEVTYGRMLNFLRNEHNKLMLTVKRAKDA